MLKKSYQIISLKHFLFFRFLFQVIHVTTSHKVLFSYFKQEGIVMQCRAWPQSFLPTQDEPF